MGRRGCRGQVAIEFLLICAIAMLMSLPLIVIFFKQSETLQTNIAASQLDKIASELRDAADDVYYLGSPSKKTLTLYFPENINSVTISGNTIVFKTPTSNGESETVKWTAANITGSFSVTPGLHKITVIASSTEVLISEG